MESKSYRVIELGGLVVRGHVSQHPPVTCEELRPKETGWWQRRDQHPVPLLGSLRKALCGLPYS